MSIVALKKRESKIQNRETLRTEAHKTIKLLIITLSIMIVTLAVTSFMISTQSSQKGYTFQQQKLKNESLKDENTKLTQLITDITSFTQIKNNDQLGTMKNLDEVSEKTYITREDTIVK